MPEAAAEDVPALQSPRGEGGAAPAPPALAPGWTAGDVAMLQELAELAMAHARAITLELMAHAERVAIGDLTPLSRAAVMESNAGFSRAARCLRLTLALKAQARDPNHTGSSPASGGGGPSEAAGRRRVEGAATSRTLQPLTTETLSETDRPERDIEREVERDSWGGGAPASPAEAIARIQTSLAGVRRHYGEGLSFEDTILNSRHTLPQTKLQAGRIEYCVPETPSAGAREVAPNGRPPHPIHNPGGYPNYAAYRAAADAMHEPALARKHARKPRSRGPP